MRIRYKDQDLEVEVIAYDPADDYQPYMFRFPAGTTVYDDVPTWVPSDEYTVLVEAVDQRENDDIDCMDALQAVIDIISAELALREHDKETRAVES